MDKAKYITLQRQTLTDFQILVPFLVTYPNNLITTVWKLCKLLTKLQNLIYEKKHQQCNVWKLCRLLTNFQFIVLTEKMKRTLVCEFRCFNQVEVRKFA